ncbi:hypothetical protein DXG01_011020, partial [Tephrocybe rancida]
DLRYLLSQGHDRTVELAGLSDDEAATRREGWSARARQEFSIYQDLLKLCGGGLEQRLTDAKTADEIQLIADLLQNGTSSSRSEDTKSMKAAVIDWITPPGGSLSPPLNRHEKMSRGYNHDVTGALLCPAGVDWNNPEYNPSTTY